MIKNEAVLTRNFTNVYPELIDHIISHGIMLDSRAGMTFEVLDFKTTILNPIERCTGGAGRNINVFFLLAEALWIWAGRNDVEFLKLFNARMGEYSDNGKTFNAPYGFRLRHYGHDSNNAFIAEYREEDSRWQAAQFEIDFRPPFQMDQIKWVLNLLQKDPNTRRAVVSIWNAEFDTKESKDIPCNDLLMFKVREGQLYLTVANRSNDLHWGLCTNVFQFSFILELMANILGLEVGHQTHNSQSLHIYKTNEITGIMQDNIARQNFGHTNLYDYVNASRMNLYFKTIKTTKWRLQVVDQVVNEIINDLTAQSKGHIPRYNPDSPPYFLHIHHILRTYMFYKACPVGEREEGKMHAIKMLLEHKNSTPYPVCEDYYLLAINWFAQRLPADKVKQVVGTSNVFPNFSNEWLGKL